jgi:hypothetical protein
MSFQVFISYKSEFLTFAQDVQGHLHDWGYQTWLDVDKVRPGEYFRHKIQEGLDTSDVLLMVLTDEAQKSREVMAEVDYFLDEARKPVIPLRHQEFKPLYIFVSIQYIDFVTDRNSGFQRLKARLAEMTLATSVSETAAVDPVKPAPPPPPTSALLPHTPVSAPLPARPPTSVQSPRSNSAPWAFTVGLAAAAVVVLSGVSVLLSLSENNISAINGDLGSAFWQVWAVPTGLFAAFTILGVGYWLWQRQRIDLVADRHRESENRAVLLRNVREYWLKGVLEPALAAGQFGMTLSSAPGLVLRHNDYGDYPFPANPNILELFNDLNRELLILGAPGAGKTVLLLQLAQALVERAERDPAKAMPVVFNLSSWAAERLPLTDWLVEEMRLKYNVPANIGARWVAQSAILLLLDGLDEVAAEYRDLCVAAINTFREQYPTADLAVCSRIADYQSLTHRLDLRGAILLEPLSQPVIDSYLARPGLEALRAAVATDTELQAMSSTPFLLNALAYAYVGATADELAGVANRRESLFARWTERRLAAQSEADFSPEQTRRWLSWLARKLVEHDKIVFYIEELQPDWMRGNLLLFRLLVGLVVGLRMALMASLSVGIPLWLLTGSVATGLMGGGLVALLLGLIVGGQAALAKPDIILAETLIWQMTPRGKKIGTLLALAVGLPIYFLVSSVTDQGAAAIIAFGSGMAAGFAMVLIYGLRPGDNVSARTTPNEGIRKSAFYTLMLGATAGIAVGLSIGLSVAVAVGLVINLATGLAVGVAVGIPAALITGVLAGGGQVVVRHNVLRFLLAREGAAPRRGYARFLDYCARAGILRKVGGGYLFAHRYLLEYFAGKTV